MTEKDFEGFALLITDALAFYRQDVSSFAMGVWWQACQRYTLQDVSRALTRHATHPDRGQFAPKPADLVRLLDGSITDRAAAAWGKALDAASRVGAYTDVVFDDPAIHAVIEDMGGWPKFCRGDLKDLSYLRHSFAQSYAAYVERGQFGYPRRLMGDRSPDDVYAKRGLPPPRPAVVGDVEKARAVARGGSAAGKTAITFAGRVDSVVKALLASAPKEIA